MNIHARPNILAGVAIAAIATPPSTTNRVDNEEAGDEVANPGPLARDLSAALTRPAIERAMRLVADWQLTTREARFNRKWTFAALYRGLMAASRGTGEPRYHDAVQRFAEQVGWRLDESRFPHADDMAVAESFIALAGEQPAAQDRRLADTRRVLERLLARPDDPQKLLWWWCDALFMGPPVLAEMYAITGERRYLDFMDEHWWQTSAALYDPRESLYSRDASFLKKTEANGRKLFWARGNGWVLAGLARVLTIMPKDYPSRPKYIAQFRAMADKVRSLQGADGLWKAGLLDQAAYKSSEISGSAFFTYALAWGVNNGILPRDVYVPVLRKAWSGMVQHVYANGRLGSIQPIGASPDSFLPSSSYCYGVGAFLLAGSELLALN